MPKATSKTSDQEEGASESRSILDFLYHDSRRIGSFLSQFEGDGHLQQLTRSKDGLRGKREASESDMKGSVGVASGSLKGTTETSLEMAEGYARVFDPYWSNARAFLDHLSEHDMLQRNLEEAEVGQFVLIKGWLSVLDLVMFKEAWKLPSIQRAVKSGFISKAKAHMTAAEKVAHQEQKHNTETMLEMIQIMPHAVHASMITSGDFAAMVWCTLRQEYLVTPATDLTLAHGATMPGEWAIVGILSAAPEFVTPEVVQEGSTALGVMESVVGNVTKMLAPIVRVALGRPAVAYAVTPLLIYREVA